MGHSIKALLDMVRTDAVMFSGMREEEFYRRGYHLNPENSPRDSDEEPLTVEFGLELVRYVDEQGVERYRWVDD